MKSLVEYINESKTGDLYIIVSDNIKNPNNITDSDIKNIIKSVKSAFGFELPENEAKSLANTVVKDFPELFEK